MTPVIETRPDGLRSVVVPMADRRSVSIGIWAGVGGRHETPERSGISHFLEHIVFKGTKTRTASQIKESIEGVGGSLNAFTAEEHTCFLAKVSQKHFEDVLAVLADMVLDASIRKSDVDKERTVIQEEIKMTEDQPAQLVDELLSQILWPEHPLGRPLAGTHETVGAITEKELTAYRDSHYSPGNLTVVAAGGVEPQGLRKALGRVFGQGRSGSATPPGEPFKKRMTGFKVLVRDKPTEQTHLSLAVHAPEKGHPLEPATDLLSILLGGNMSSRLFNEVREERGLAYDIGSYVRKYHETGAFVVSAGVDHRKLSDALAVILEQLRKVAAEAPSVEELRRAREFYLGQLELSLENTMNQMLYAGESLLSMGRVKPFEEVIADIVSVTPERIREAAQNLFALPFHLSVVGPGLKEEKLASLFSR
jgi:predicted Zn-dependent peptidase